MWTQAGRSRLWLNEWVADPWFRRKPVCAYYEALHKNAKDPRGLRRDLERLFMIILGKKFTRTVMGGPNRRQSLTDFFQRGMVLARTLRPFLAPTDRVLDFGGGIGRLAHPLAPHCAELVSVDRNPLMKVYGPKFGDRVQFVQNDQLPDDQSFDVAYSVSVFFHLSLKEQQTALRYLFERLKPGGRLYVDLILGDRTTLPSGPHNMGMVTEADFRRIASPYFTLSPISLWNSGFVGIRRTEMAG